MRKQTTAAAVAVVGILAAGCGGGGGGGAASSSTTTTTPSKPPLAQAALLNLMLTPPEIDSAVGGTGTTVGDKFDTLPDDSTTNYPQGYKFPAECLFIQHPGEAPVYAGSGNTAVHRERATTPLPASSNDPDPEVTEVVVLFPSAKEANAFFTASTQRWPECANRQGTIPGDADSPEIQWKVGVVSNTNGVLSTTTNVSATKNGTTLAQSCQRALTVRNNVVIDVDACRKDPGDLAVTVANQIAGKVDKQ
ncbi:sensor domain-containing protein [Mycobacterium sp. 1245805.9]|uniref:sensor domain-containing protein n=1 Tax=Mycobacterium sp. 1245805.9 TaxID=1856862 RepID=UPI0007FC3943|nr:sensor domain-containing protein [Mycobacterium sp. 1245805.9]OBI91867.1 nuclease PIN [Mycobacterium sp. 1245805.9]